MGWSRVWRSRLSAIGLVCGASACTVSWQAPRDAGADAAPTLDAAAADSAADAGFADAEVHRDASVARDADAKQEPRDAACGEDAECDPNAAPGPLGAIGFEGASCTPEGAQTCASRAGARRLACRDGHLRLAEACAPGSLCDSENDAGIAGQCRDIGACGARDEKNIGCVGSLRAQCDGAGRALALLPCDPTSHCEGAGECVCDSGSRRDADGVFCEPLSLFGVFGQGGAGAYCATDGQSVLGDPLGFWVAVLFRTFQAVTEKSVVAAQRSLGAGWALLETREGMAFEVGDAAHGTVPGVFSSLPYVRPDADIELGRTQLAVAVFSGANLTLYVADHVTGAAQPASFAVPSAAPLCVLGERVADGARGSASSVVYALAGGSPAPTADEVHALFESTKRDGELAGIRDKTQYTFDFAGNSPMTVPIRVDNRGGPALSLEAAGYVGPSGGFTNWGW